MWTSFFTIVALLSLCLTLAAIAVEASDSTDGLNGV
jgi:hypothetical protein